MQFPKSTSFSLETCSLSLSKSIPMLLLLLVLSLGLSVVASADDHAGDSANASLGCGSTIYIAPMDGDLDTYIRANFVEQHVPLKVVTDKDNADLIMTGTSTHEQEHWYTPGADKNTGAVTISDKSGSFLWGSAAGDRNMLLGNWAKHGPEKIASRIVDKLRKTALQHCR